MSESHFERLQEDRAGAEAAGIGGTPSSEPPATDAGEHNPAMDPVIEGGGGESEGFEEAERELIDHASHGDQHAARRVLQDAPDEEADARSASDAEADEEEPPDL